MKNEDYNPTSHTLTILMVLAVCLAVILSLLKHLKKQFPTATIHGHRDFAAKACPSFDATTEYKNL